MKKFLGITLLLLMIALQSHGQSLMFYVRGGLWRPWEAQNAYATLTPTWQPTANVGIGFRPSLSPRCFLQATLGFGYQSLKYEYESSKIVKNVESDLDLLATELSIGLDYKPPLVSQASIFLGIRATFPLAAFGFYKVKYRQFPIRYDSVYVDHFTRLRSPVTIGPELSFAYHIPLSNGSVLSPHIHTWVGMNSIWRRTLETSHYPKPLSLTLGLTYILPRQARSKSSKP